MSKIDWSYHRPGWVTCGKTQEFLANADVNLKEEQNAKKETIKAADALALARQVNDIYTAKGKKVVHVDMKKDKPDDETLTKLIVGPSGNLRAPALQKGKTLVVGFHPETYESIFSWFEHMMTVNIDRLPDDSKGYRLTTELHVVEPVVEPVVKPVDEVFEFFGDAFQLEQLTPFWLHFHVQTPRPIQMRAGTLIDYRLRLHGLPVRWRSKISEWVPMERFVDEQVVRPYRYWHHLYTFEPSEEGTMLNRQSSQPCQYVD
jgi:ligand-binding SRPBCC domain-containing protein/arsenate reductase-like glutaredoxin family protein